MMMRLKYSLVLLFVVFFSLSNSRATSNKDFGLDDCFSECTSVFPNLGDTGLESICENLENKKIGNCLAPPPGEECSALLITGIVDGPLTGGKPKAIELYATRDISDLSIYGLSRSVNGGGAPASPQFSDFTGSVSAGTYIYVTNDAQDFVTFFGISPDYETTSDAVNINGDDAVLLYKDGIVVDVIGEPEVDGSGESWEYMDGWAYRSSTSSTHKNPSVVSDYTYSTNGLDNASTNATANEPFPIGTYSPECSAGGSSAQECSALLITGIVDGPLTGGKPKAIELYATRDISDLSIYGLSRSVNGGGAPASPQFSDFTGSVSAGTYIYVTNDAQDFVTFFGISPDYETTSDAVNINGDDAVLLYKDGIVVDVIGEPEVDGSGESWEYMDGWAYRSSTSSTHKNPSVVSDYTYSTNGLDNASTNATANEPFPIGTYSPECSAGGSSAQECSALLITGIVDGPLTGGKPKAIELYATRDISDLSIYGLSRSVNGGGAPASPQFSDFTGSVSAGTYIYVTNDAQDFVTFFGISPDYETTSDAVNINGDDAVLLYKDGIVVDVIGEPEVDGSGESWEYMDGWAYRSSTSSTHKNPSVVSDYTYSTNGLDNASTNATANEPFPIGTYSPECSAEELLEIMCAEFVTINCDESIDTVSTGRPRVVSACSEDVTIEYEDEMIKTVDCSIGGDTLRRSFSISDGCNDTTCIQDIIIKYPAPSIEVKDLEIQVGDSKAVEITAADVVISVTYMCNDVAYETIISQTQFTEEDEGENNITVTVTDECGNSVQGQAVVSVAVNCAIECPTDFTVTAEPGYCGAFVTFPAPKVQANCAYDVDIATNANGAFLPIGENEIKYTTITDTCAFTVTVEEFSNASTTLVCNDLVHASVANNNCEAVITADMILEGGSYGCYDSFDIEIATDMQFTNIVGSGNPVIMSGAHVGNRYFVRITSKDGNTCWGEVLIEDKSVPPLECEPEPLVTKCDGKTSIGSPVYGSFVVYENTDRTTISSKNVYTCGFSPGFGFKTGKNKYYRVYDLADFGINEDPMTVKYVRLGIKQSTGNAAASPMPVDPSVDCEVRLYEFNDPESYDPTAASFTQADLKQIGTTQTISIPDTRNEFRNFNFDTPVTIAKGTRYIIMELETPNVTFEFFFLGTNNAGEDLPSYVSSSDCDINDIETFASIGQPNTNILMMFGAEGFGSPIGFPMPDAAVVVPSEGTGPFVVSNFDPCGDVTLTYTDEEEDLECESEYSSVVHRTWTVVDKSGNTNTCMEDIFRERPHIDSIDIPSTLELTCAEYEAGGGVLGEEGLQCDNIIVSYDDKTVNMCAGSFKIIREYTLVDWCTGETREEIQVIKVTDNVGPEVTCPADVTLSTDFYSCQGEAYPVPTPEIFDACTKATDLDFTVSLSGGGYVSSLPGSNNYVIEGLEVGTHVVTYTVTDNCGNETQCEQRITVEDNVPPTPICDQETKIGIGADGTARLHWTTIEDGSYDNCKIVKNCLLRMDVSEGGKYCNDVKNDCKDYVYFCCEDVGKTIQVLYRVTDGAGNVNTCMVNVTIEDKLKPVVVTPPNVTISCEYDYDVDNLSAYFGKVVRKGEVRDSVLTDDPGRDECLAPVGYTGPTFWGLDGHAGDNCEYTIEELTPLVNLDKCGEGTITRRWSVEDESGSKSVGSQTITVEACDIFTEDDITWPRAELELDACAAGGLDPEALNSKPTYEDGFCGIIAEGYEDEVYTVVEDACFKIKRTWTIIDWCRYNKETGEGSWTFVQYIKVTDMGAISILIEDFTHEDTTAGCTSYVELLPELDSSCSLEEYFDWRYTVDLDNDGTIEREGYARDASGNFPYGTHRVTWKADNGCGNVAKRSILLTVTDGKAPTAVCYHGLSVEVMPSSGEIELGAEYFNRGSFDNCTLSGDLQISYSSDVNDTLTKWTCADLAGLDVMRIEVELWATDAAGNQAYCVTYLELQDNDDVCPNGATGLVSGLIETEEGSGINESEVILQTPNSPTPSVTRTDMVGSYEMLASMDNSYVLSANNNSDLLNGVTAYDLTLIQRHILGITELTSPYKLIAADINRDGQISGKDLTELRRLILGIDVDFRNNASWQMVDAKASLTPAVVPIDYAQEIAIAHMSTSMQGQDFIGVKIGDVNGTVDATGGLSETRTGVVASLEVEEAAYGVGEEVRVAVRAGETMTMDAYQFTLDFGSSLYYEGVESGVLAVESGNIGSQSLGAGMLSTAWYTDNAVEVSEGEVLFTFVFRAAAGGTLSEALTLSSELTRALAYVNGEERGVELRVGGTSISGEEFALEQNEPNPFSGTTIIGYVLPEAGEAVLTIRDVQGRVVYVEEQAGVAGMNQVEVTRDELGAAGVLYYTLESGDYTATKKMVVID